jgi:hypothetical protein
VKNWFQAFAFHKCTLYRYSLVLDKEFPVQADGQPWWGSARWNQVDP